jgi:hypothetical protein
MAPSSVPWVVAPRSRPHQRQLSGYVRSLGVMAHSAKMWYLSAVSHDFFSKNRLKSKKCGRAPASVPPPLLRFPRSVWFFCQCVTGWPGVASRLLVCPVTALTSLWLPRLRCARDSFVSWLILNNLSTIREQPFFTSLHRATYGAARGEAIVSHRGRRTPMISEKSLCISNSLK